MAIYVGSRYEYAEVDRVVGADGALRPTVFAPGPSTAPTDPLTYLVIDGDRLDQIAQKIFGRADLWWVIANANPDLLIPDPLVPGSVLRIPRGRPGT